MAAPLFLGRLYVLARKVGKLTRKGEVSWETYELESSSGLTNLILKFFAIYLRVQSYGCKDTVKCICNDSGAGKVSAQTCAILPVPAQ